MHLRTQHILTTLLVVLCSILNIKAQQKIVYVYEIHDEIGPSVSRLTEKAVAEAEQKKASYLVIDMDTYGGLVTDADDIRTALLRTKIPTVVFIRNNAASAGALISIACDSIYMMPGSTIGAACVVNEQGEIMPEKYQSYMRTKMRATAEQTGRRPEIAEGMTDVDLVVDSIKEKGKIITFTPADAQKYGYCNGIADNLDAVIAKLAGGPYKVEKHESSLSEAIVLWLVKPGVSGLLLLLIFGGIYFEFKAPGTLLPILTSVVAALLYFAPLYLEGLAANWEILIFGIGIILILLEIFVIPGFGITGILGIVLVILGLTLALVRNINFDFTFVPKSGLALSFLMVTLAMAAPLAILLAFGQRIFNSAFFSRVSVKAVMDNAQGFTVRDNATHQLIGLTGTAVTDLRPAGKVEVNGERYDAASDGTFIHKGESIRITGMRSNYLVVEKA